MPQDITVTVVNDEVELLPVNHIVTGDTVRYVGPTGTKVRVEFELPFSNAKDVVQDGESRRFGRAGNYFGKCFVTLADGREIGWSPNQPKAGGEHDVRP